MKQVLLFDAEQSPVLAQAEPLLADDGWQLRRTTDYADALQQIRSGQLQALIIAPPAHVQPDADAQLDRIIQEADAHHVATMLIGGSRAPACTERCVLWDHLPTDVDANILVLRLATLQRFGGQVRRMDSELDEMHRLGQRLRKHFSEVDQEMQLAGRLQRDFLPQTDKPIGPARFATIYRPASWVSGDIYDIFRVDEKHIAFYVADAVGHGLAAGLLTMFIKRAIVAKNIHTNGTYEILSPSQTLSTLNEALLSQTLPNCQFVTAAYCLLNTETFELSFARGGHPYPLRVLADGRIDELKSQGGLLGVFSGAEFPTRTVVLNPGEKVVMYTDGLEDSFAEKDKLTHRQAIMRLADCSAPELLHRLSNDLDMQRGSANPMDDVTAVVMELTPETQATAHVGFEAGWEGRIPAKNTVPADRPAIHCDKPDSAYVPELAESNPSVEVPRL